MWHALGVADAYAGKLWEGGEENILSVSKYVVLLAVLLSQPTR